MIENYNPQKCYKQSKVQLNILLTDEIPVYQNPRRLSPLELNIVDNQISEREQRRIFSVTKKRTKEHIIENERGLQHTKLETLLQLKEPSLYRVINYTQNTLALMKL